MKIKEYSQIYNIFKWSEYVHIEQSFNQLVPY